MPRIYFTGRKKIDQNQVSIVLRPGRTPEFSATVDLSRLQRSLPRDARVIVEAFHNTMLQRFDFGTVTDCRPREPLQLRNFDEWDRPRFRVRVVGVLNKAGVVLASCERIDATVAEDGPEGGRSMLKLYPKPDSEMKGELWKLTEIGGGFQLWYNKDVTRFAAGIKGKLPDVLGAILPAALREILARVHLWEEVNADPSEWTVFASRISGEAPPQGSNGNRPELNDMAGWIDRVIAAFCRNRARFVERIAQLEETTHEPSTV